MRNLYRAGKILLFLYTIVAIVSPFVLDGIAITQSYVDSHIRVYEDSSRAGYTRAEIFFNPDINRYRICFHIGDGWGYVFNPALFILLFILKLIAPAVIILWCGYAIMQTYRWWTRKKKARFPFPYIQNLPNVGRD